MRPCSFSIGSSSPSMISSMVSGHNLGGNISIGSDGAGCESLDPVQKEGALFVKVTVQLRISSSRHSFLLTPEGEYWGLWLIVVRVRLLPSLSQLFYNG